MSDVANDLRTLPLQIQQSTAGITTAAANSIVMAAVDHAVKNNWRINVAVVDRGGNLIAFLRMPGAFLHSIDIAVDKAYTAASFGFPTRQWMTLIGHDDGMKLGFTARPRLVVFGGGLPIQVAGDWIGGVGVSGASEDEDEECAMAGLKSIGLK